MSELGVVVRVKTSQDEFYFVAVGYALTPKKTKLLAAQARRDFQLGNI